MIGPAGRRGDFHGAGAHADMRLAGVEIADAAVAITRLQLLPQLGGEIIRRRMAVADLQNDETALALGLLALGFRGGISGPAGARLHRARAGLHDRLRRHCSWRGSAAIGGRRRHVGNARLRSRLGRCRNARIVAAALRRMRRFRRDLLDHRDQAARPRHRRRAQYRDQHAGDEDDASAAHQHGGERQAVPLRTSHRSDPKKLRPKIRGRFLTRSQYYARRQRSALR